MQRVRRYKKNQPSTHCIAKRREKKQLPTRKHIHRTFRKKEPGYINERNDLPNNNKRTHLMRQTKTLNAGSHTHMLNQLFCQRTCESVRYCFHWDRKKNSLARSHPHCSRICTYRALFIYAHKDETPQEVCGIHVMWLGFFWSCVRCAHSHMRTSMPFPCVHNWLDLVAHSFVFFSLRSLRVWFDMKVCDPFARYQMMFMIISDVLIFKWFNYMLTPTADFNG